MFDLSVLNLTVIEQRKYMRHGILYFIGSFKLFLALSVKILIYFAIIVIITFIILNFYSEKIYFLVHFWLNSKFSIL